MTTLGPDSLRALADNKQSVHFTHVLAHADAWRAERIQLAHADNRIANLEADNAVLRKRLEEVVAKFDAYHREITALVPEDWEPGTVWEHAPEGCEICAFLVAALAGEEKP